MSAGLDVTQVADWFLACGVLKHGVARTGCDACTYESRLTFSFMWRDFCPSCQAKRLAVLTR